MACIHCYWQIKTGWLSVMQERLPIPGLVGVTKQNIAGAASADKVARHLDTEGLSAMECDPCEKEGSKVLILSLFELIMQEKEKFEESGFF